MLSIKKNETYRVYTVREGKKKDNSPYVLIKLRECDIQPEGLENPSASKSPINIWMDKLPENLKGIRDGSLIKFTDFSGFTFYREKFESYGKVQYMAGHEVLGAVLELVK